MILLCNSLPFISLFFFLSSLFFSLLFLLFPSLLLPTNPSTSMEQKPSSERHELPRLCYVFVFAGFLSKNMGSSSELRDLRWNLELVSRHAPGRARKAVRPPVLNYIVSKVEALTLTAECTPGACRNLVFTRISLRKASYKYF